MGKFATFDDKNDMDIGTTGDDVTLLQKRLERYGYLRPGSYTEGTYDEKTKKAVSKYQRLGGLTIDGVAGKETKTQLERPRCPHEDSPGGSAVGAYTASGSTYNTNNLTYAFENDPADLTAAQAKTEIRAQFAKWEAVCGLSFTEVTTAQNPTFKIAWKKGDHNDGSPFDGVGNVLAHAFYPPPRGGNHAGELHFDEDETFSLDGANGTYKLAAVALHEIGHLLGLEHSTDDDAVMAPYYDVAKTELAADDIAGARQLYPNAMTQTAVVNDSLSSTDTSDSWWLDVAANGMKVTLECAAGTDFDLYVKMGGTASPQDWDWRSWNVGNEQLLITDNPAGRAYFLVDRYEGDGTYKLTCEYNLP